MTSFIRNFTVAIIGVTALAALIAPQYIETALMEQCLTRDWPAHQDQAHVEYCMSYGFPVGE